MKGGGAVFTELIAVPSQPLGVAMFLRQSRLAAPSLRGNRLQMFGLLATVTVTVMWGFHCACFHTFPPLPHEH